MHLTQGHVTDMDYLILSPEPEIGNLKLNLKKSLMVTQLVWNGTSVSVNCLDKHRVTAQITLLCYCWFNCLSVLLQ